MESETERVSEKLQSDCGVNSGFNFGVGVTAVAAAIVIGYCLYLYWPR